MSADATSELVALAEFLWKVLDESGLSVEQVRARFTKEHFPGKLPIPSTSTVYKRLRCEQLENAGRLVDAIIDVCVPPERRDSARDKANDLKSAVRANRSATPQKPPSDDCTTHLTQLAETQQRVIQMQDEIFQLREKTRGDQHHDPANLAQLRRELNQANADRVQLKTSLDAARRELQVLRSQLAAATAPLREEQDRELDRVEQRLRELDPDGGRFAAVIRRAFDLVYDGARTGRYSPDQLTRKEKTYLSEVVVSELRREFDLAPGDELDAQVSGIDLDLKFSNRANWMIPSMLASRLCLLITADDRRSEFSVGLLRASPEFLRTGINKDGNQLLNTTGRASIRFLARDAALPRNTLLHTDPEDLAAIFEKGGSTSRVLELFRRVQGRKVDPASLAAVAMSEQAARRVREARQTLLAEGVLLLGSSDAELCAKLKLPQPNRREYVSIRLTRRSSHHGDAPAVELGGIIWVVAAPDDQAEPIPIARSTQHRQPAVSPHHAN